MFRCIILVVISGWLFGCGGPGMDGRIGSTPDQPAILDYAGAGYQSPNYHPYETQSYFYRWDGTVYIGGDLEPRERLRRVINTSINGFQFYMESAKKCGAVPNSCGYMAT